MYDPVLGETHLRLMPSLLVNAVLGLLPLLGVLHSRRDGADLDLLEGCAEVGVERESIGRIDIATGWVFLQDLVLCTSKRLQVTL